MNTSSSDRNALPERLADRMRAARSEIVGRWLERIIARVSIEPQRVFPTDELLNHVPILVDGIADFLEHGDTANEGTVPLDAKSMELGALRHAQGFDAYEILKEHELLANILYNVMREELALVGDAKPDEVAYCWQRVAEVLEHIRQSTMNHFLRKSAEQVRLREERLRRFNRMVSHELKNRVGAIRGAAGLLMEPWLEPAQVTQFNRIVAQNAEGMQRVIENLAALSRMDGDTRQQRNVMLPQAVAEVVRQLRDAATLNHVNVQVDAQIPAVEVDAAAVELCLGNYVSNAIKYADKRKPKRWVQVTAELIVSTPARPGELLVRVADNGLGVDPPARERLFEQFYRAHGDTVTGIEGTGLGLSIVQETVASLGGRVWTEFPAEGGSVFGFALPSRREEDAAAAGTRRELPASIDPRAPSALPGEGPAGQA
ncbi:MAG: ATP-binding region ATPase domain protein [Gemmatimonadetes bacterium]|nr:ATP-binding region ATPase domain protein [Gemmatimonadota bacterium]